MITAGYNAKLYKLGAKTTDTNRISLTRLRKEGNLTVFAVNNEYSFLVKDAIRIEVFKADGEFIAEYVGNDTSFLIEIEFKISKINYDEGLIYLDLTVLPETVATVQLYLYSYYLNVLVANVTDLSISKTATIIESTTRDDVPNKTKIVGLKDKSANFSTIDVVDVYFFNLLEVGSSVGLKIDNGDGTNTSGRFFIESINKQAELEGVQTIEVSLQGTKSNITKQNEY